MGYTHYFTKTKKVSEKQWNEFVETCKKLYENLPDIHTDNEFNYGKPIMIGDGAGEGKPEFTKNYVSFNGKSPKGSNLDLSHETFGIEKNSEVGKSDFCKTARKPYDLLVVACLIAAKDILGYKISSDGIDQRPEFIHVKYEDLQPAFKFYSEVIKPVTPEQIMNE